MSSGEGREEPGKRPEQERTRRPTPRPGGLTPPPRTRSGTSRRVEHRSAQTEHERAKNSMFGRMFGRQGMDEALDRRFEPYEYQSSRPILRWLFLGLITFVVVGAFSVFVDVQFRSTVNEWRDDGFNEIPIEPEEIARATLIADLELQDADVLLCNEEELATGSAIAQGCRSIDRVAEHAKKLGLQCTTLEHMASVSSENYPPAPECDRIVDTSTRFDDMNTTSNMVSVALVLILIVVAFPFSSFTHRTSRNLRTLRAEGQKHSPDGTVIRFFIPVLNIYKPLFMFSELSRGSDPRLPESSRDQWKKKGMVSPIIVLWAIAWGAFLVYNPITVSRFFFGQRVDLSDVAAATSGLIAADILIIVLGGLTILMANTLSRWQDMKAARHGTVTVTPPRPRDPLEKALEEGIRRQEQNAAAAREKRSNRRKK